MSENLYQETMMYNAQGGVPWHKKGIAINGLATAEEAMIAAKLDFEVRKEQLFRIVPGDIKPMKAYATINSKTDDELGIVGEDYTPIQNKSSFTFFDEFVGHGQAIYETAGALGKGEKVWLLAKLPTGFEPIQGDRVDNYCLLYNTHNGTLPCCVMFVNIRVVCQNTLNMALRNAQQIVKIKHSVNAEHRLAEAGLIAKEMNEYYKRVGENFDALGKFIIDDAMITEYQDMMFGKEKELPDRGPARSIRLNRIEMFKGRRANGMGVDIPGVSDTAWGLYNTMTEMADWDLVKKREENDRLFESVLFGTSAKFKQEAFDNIMDLVTVRSK